MRCLTCGKRIQQQMKECPNCGAMTPRTESATRIATASADSAMADWKSVLTPRASPLPTPPPMPPTRSSPFGGEPSPASPTPFPPAANSPPNEEAEDEAQPAGPQAPPWTQYIFPAIIILWAAFRMFGPNIGRFIAGEPWDAPEESAETAVALPELRQLVVAERADENGPVGVADKFSSATAKSVVLFSAWRGERGEHQFNVNWHSPSGKVMTGAQKVLLIPKNPTPRFFVLGELPIGEFSEAGRWRVEIQLNGSSIAAHEFVIE